MSRVKLNWKKPIFIAGQSDSGTKCLFYSLLFGHEDLGGFRLETHNFGIPSLTFPPRLYALEPQFSHYHKVSQDDVETSKSGPLRASEVKQRFQFYADNAGPPEESGNYFIPGSRLIFKDPRLSLRVRWLKDIFPDCFIVGIVRHPVAIAEGVLKRTKGAKMPEVIEQIRLNYLTMEKDAEKIDGFRMIRYEDMIKSPRYPSKKDKFWTSLLDFLELDKTKFRLPSRGIFTRFEQGINEEKFKKVSTEDKRLIKEKLLFMFQKYNYD